MLSTVVTYELALPATLPEGTVDAIPTTPQANPDGCPSGSRIGRQLGGPQVGSEDFIADSCRRHTAV